MGIKNEPVKLSGKVKVNKDGEGKNFLKVFFTGSFVEALKYAFDNVFVPFTKDAICRTSNNIINYWVNGDKPVDNRSAGANRVSYWQGSYSQSRTSYQDPRPLNRNNSVYNVGTIVFDDRGDAEAVLLRLKENLDVYKVATVADLYELSGERFNFTDYDYGWKDLKSAYVGRTNDGKFVIELPKAIPLK